MIDVPPIQEQFHIATESTAGETTYVLYDGTLLIKADLLSHEAAMSVLPQLDWLKDVWYIPNVGRGDHPASFPVELPRRLIRLFAHAPDAVICDPLMGSGAVGVAARQLGRAFVGNDRQAAFVDLARSRIAAAVLTEMVV